MKPVPIMQYLDHFGRVGQADAQPAAQGPAPAPFKPRTLRAVPDAAPRASLPVEPRLARNRRRRAAKARRRRGRGLRAAPSEAEIEARIAEAYEQRPP